MAVVFRWESRVGDLLLNKCSPSTVYSWEKWLLGSPPKETHLTPQGLYRSILIEEMN